MTDNDHSDDDIAPLLRIGLDETQAGGPSPHWEPPSVEELQRALPQYKISGFIARGGMGAVYRGTQKALQRTVAIKVLPPGIDDGDRHFSERFKQEAQTMARLSHPNIVTVYEAGEVQSSPLAPREEHSASAGNDPAISPGDVPAGGSAKLISQERDGYCALLYIVMEFIDGTDVGQLIASEGMVEPRRAIQITSAVCEALAFAHEEGIIHRDIKPSNIMLDRKGRVKVADFGLAKLVNVDTLSFSSATGTVGTPEFIAPEAHIAGTQVDQRADIYAVGVMLYQMLTGQIPRGKFSAPSSVAPEVDKRLDAIVDKALQTNREQRYSTASEMKSDVDAAVTPVQRVVAPPRQSKRRLWLGLAAGVLVLIGVISFAMRPAQTVVSASSKSSSLQIPAATPRFPTGQWTRVPPEALREKELITDAEGWSILPASRTRTEIPGAKGRNWGLRVTFRNQPVGKSMPEIALRRKDDCSLTAQLYREGTKFVVLQHNGSLPEGDPNEYQALSQKLLTGAVPAGTPFTIEFIAVGTHLIARCHGFTVQCEITPEGPTTGDIAIRGPSHDAFRDVEVLNLEGLDEAEAMKIAGMEK